MKKFIYLAFAIFALASCQQNGGYNQTQGTTTVLPYNGNTNTSTNATAQPLTDLGNNFNLQAAGEIVRTSANVQDMEQKLNQPNGVNNFVIPGDQNVAYIKATEYSNNGVNGVTLTAVGSNNQTQDLTNIELTRVGYQVTMNIIGNPTLYGQSAYYSSNYGLSDFPLYHYLFYPHPLYISPWGFGRYPSYYHSYGYCGGGLYASHINTYTHSRYVTKTTTTRVVSHSPTKVNNAPAVSQRVKNMSAPQASQKSFTKTTPSAAKPNIGGFTKTTPSAPAAKSSGSSWFGGSKSSGGSRSFGSSSGGSRSFGSSSGGRSSGGGGRRSDLRFKQNIQPLGTSLAKVCSLKGVTYDWKVNQFPAEKFDTTKQIGFIAQDLEKVYPQVVNTRPDGYKTVNYDLLVPALVEAIKELNTKVAKQDSIIQSLTPAAQTSTKPSYKVRAL